MCTCAKMGTERERESAEMDIITMGTACTDSDGYVYREYHPQKDATVHIPNSAARLTQLAARA